MRSLLDLYLLALVVRHEGRLVTFDRATAVSAIRGTRDKHSAPSSTPFGGQPRAPRQLLDIR